MACCKPIATDTIVQIDPGNFVGTKSTDENSAVVASTEEEGKQSNSAS